MTFSVKARNRLFDGPLSSISTRALAPPTQVRELVATEDAGGILVSWQEPFDTGYGDTAARVDYVVESSLCPDFAHRDLECIYHSQVVSGSITNSDYPSFHLRLGKDVLEVEADIYHIRVTALNEAGAGASRETNQRYMMNVTALTAVQIGQDLEVKWRYGVLDQPNLKVVVKVWSDHDFMASYDFTVSDMTCQTPSRPLDCGSGFTDPFRCEECQPHAYTDECGGVCDSATTCNANGRCNGRTGECECYDGWSGADCSISTSDICGLGTQGYYSNRCQEGTYSRGCEEICDDVTTCNANGRCSGRTGDCECYDGWTGADCSEIDLNFSADSFAVKDSIHCEQNAYSDECGDVCISESDCDGNGRCIGRTGTCECYDGWGGAKCTLPLKPDAFTFDVHCPMNGYQRQCEKTCEQKNMCNFNGRCIGRTGECECYEGWSGHDCSI